MTIQTGKATATISDDGTILHIHIPWKLRRRGGKKVIITPDGDHHQSANDAIPIHHDPLVRALGKARRWQNMLENGEATTIKELAEMENTDKAVVSRTLRLNDLAPDIVGMILSGDYPDSLDLKTFRSGIPLDWEEQRRLFLS